MPHFQVVLKHHVIMVLFDNGILAFTSCICFFAFFGFRNDPQKHLARDKNTLMSAKAKKIVAFCHVQIIQNLTKNFYASKEIKNANFESKSDIKIFTVVTLQRNNSSMNPQQSRILQG